MPPWKVSIDAMLTILPRSPPCDAQPVMWRAAAWHRKNSVFRLVSITASQSSSEKSSASSRRIIPALLTRISRRPSLPTTVSTTSVTGSIEDRSAETSSQRRPSARTCSAVPSAGLRPTAAISAPACASAMAMPCPIPVLAPVTSAVRPVRSKGVVAMVFTLPVWCGGDRPATTRSPAPGAGSCRSCDSRRGQRLCR